MPSDAAVGRVRDRADALEAAVGRTWTGTDRAVDVEGFLRELTAIGSRMAGSAGERRAAELVADALASAGVRDVTERAFGLTAWERGETSLKLVVPDGHERSVDALALPYAPAGETVAGVVDVGDGTPGEIDAAAEAVGLGGRIAVASTTTPPGSRFVHRTEKFGYAVDAGAAAFLFANDRAGQLPPTGSLTFGAPADAMAAGVSRETGAWLREYAINTPGERGRVRLAIDAAHRAGESRNVVGRLGPEPDSGSGAEAGGELLLLAHYDAHDIAEGALDNGCGIATVVAAADVLADASLPVGLRVAAVGAEEVGLLGSERLADRLDLGDVRAVVNVDGAGRHRDLRALAHTSDATADAAAAVSRATGHPVAVEREPHPFSDQWPFVRRSVPALQFHSESGERGRGWGHTRADTRDKVDVRNVREHAALIALAVLELAAPERDIPRLDDAALAAAFREAEFETGMRAAGLWPERWG